MHFSDCISTIEEWKAQDEVLTTLPLKLPVSQYDFSRPPHSHTLSFFSFHTFIFCNPWASFVAMLSCVKLLHSRITFDPPLLRELEV